MIVINGDRFEEGLVLVFLLLFHISLPGTKKHWQPDTDSQTLLELIVT